MPDDLKPGDVIEGRYKIVRPIDQGGMGKVLLAEHVLIKRRVAVKLLRGELAEDSAAVERFMNEARAAGTLGHPNIVESTDMGFTREGLPYIVFEYLEGSLLHDEIYRVQGFPVRRALRIARQIASALGAAHTANIVHRDLKSDNVFLIDRDEVTDHVKVIDFGVSRFVEDDDAIVGTPEFMSPEQIDNPIGVDRRADIWALGVILYEMLTARRPFASDDRDELFRQIREQAPASLGRPELPKGLEALVLERFLAKQPGDRLQSMKEVESELEKYAAIVRPTFDSIPIARIDMPLPDVAQAVSLPPPPRRANHAFVAPLVLGLGAGVFATITGGTAPAEVPPDAAALQADADRLGAAIDAAAKATELRAAGYAQSPQLRAAVETDAATVKDMLKGDFTLDQAPGETFELFQTREQPPLLVRPDGPPLPLPSEHSRVQTDAKGATVTSVAPIRTARGEVGGIAVRSPIELKGPFHAATVELRGLGAPLALATGAPGEVSLEAKVPLNAALHASPVLAATVAKRYAERPGWIFPVQAAGFAGGGLFALLYAGSLLRARRHG